MRYSLALFPVVASAAVPAAVPAVIPTLKSLLLPQIPVLSLVTVPDVVSGNGFTSIATSLSTTAKAVGINTDALNIVSVQLSGSGDVAIGSPQGLLAVIDTAKALQDATNTFWQTANDLEKKVCSLALSANQQNLAAQQANLVAAVNAQIRVITNLRAVITALIQSVQSQADEFSDNEKAILGAAIRAVAAAAYAQMDPINRLADGLSKVGITTLTSIVASLSISTNALVTVAKGANFVIYS